MDLNDLTCNNGIYLYKTDSFNTITIYLNFLVNNSNRECAIIDLLCNYLLYCNKKYDSNKKISEKALDLYSLDLNFGNSYCGNQLVFSLYSNLISASVINDDYLSKAFNYINDMLKEPDFTNENVLDIVKKNSISEITVHLLDNSSLAETKYFNNVFYEENKKYEYSTDMDYISNLINSITLEELKNEYDYIINHFHSGLVFGNISNKEFNDFVNKMSLTPINDNINYFKKVDVNEEDIKESIACDQSYIYITYDIFNLSQPKVEVLNSILSDLCYEIIRNQEGLVYFSCVDIMYHLNKLYFYGEIDKSKKDLFIGTVDEIVEILNDKDELTELLFQAKDNYEIEEYNLSENQERMIDILNRFILNEYNESDIGIQSIEDLTVEDLMSSTKTLKRKNIFMLEGVEDE